MNARIDLSNARYVSIHETLFKTMLCSNSKDFKYSKNMNLKPNLLSKCTLLALFPADITKRQNPAFECLDRTLTNSPLFYSG